eukprot:TRINITY_DN6350_c0_g1_i1.p1 TRINITY_DN6350_c0_g1~~TRINITY_DN6350_c0_g1_i1.p1  ORF type:complete len:176 (+),score=18.52 TRINITY_DN6350_c0_g1_i1:130-657(+)
MDQPFSNPSTYKAIGGGKFEIDTSSMPHNQKSTTPPIGIPLHSTGYDNNMTYQPQITPIDENVQFFCFLQPAKRVMLIILALDLLWIFAPLFTAICVLLAAACAYYSVETSKNPRLRDIYLLAKLVFMIITLINALKHGSGGSIRLVLLGTIFTFYLLFIFKKSNDVLKQNEQPL